MRRLVLFALCSVISLMLASASSLADPVMAQSQQASSTNSDSSTSPPAEPVEAAASNSGASTPPAQPSTPASSAPESDGSPNRPSSRPEGRSLGLFNPQASPDTAPVAPDTRVPAKRGTGFAGPADKANSGKKTPPGGFTGASSSVSNPVATGGDPAPGRASAPTGAQELRADFGPSLPAGTPHLYVNDAFGMVHIFPDAPLEVSWDIRSVPDAYGMILFITQSEMNPCDEELNPPSGITGTQALEGQQGTVGLSVSPFTLGNDYYLAGCPVRRRSNGNFVFLGESTNMIVARYTWAPDLIVSNIFLQSDEVRFQVKNIGVAEKKPGEIRYVLKQAFLDPNGTVISEKNFFGIAAITSLSRLRANEETAEDRVTGQNITFSSNMRLTLCINIGHDPIERDFTNNCMTSNPSGLLPDLRIVGGRIVLSPPPPKDDDPWYEDVGEFIVDLFDGVEFDESGIPPGDWAEVSVQNIGSVRVAYFEMIGGVWKNGESPVTNGRVIQETIEPGQTKLIKLYFPVDHSRWDDETCCTGVAQIDPNNTLMESNEDNNKLYLEVQRIAESRDHRN